MTRRIVVVGSINTDFVVRSARTPLPGETITGDSLHIFPGGKGANQAAAAALLGSQVSMIGHFGSDGFASVAIDALRDAGVDLEGVTQVEGSSGIAIISTTYSGQNSITIVPGANSKLTSKSVEAHRGLIEDAAIVLVQLETPLSSLRATLAVAGEHRIPVVLDPAPAPAIPLPAEILRQVSWITPNESEAFTILGYPVPEGHRAMEAYASEFHKFGPRWVLLKLGERGAFLSGPSGTREFIEAPEVTAVDSTAAGDALNGALATALAEGAHPIEAARFAVAAGSLTVTRHGAIPSLPTREQLDSFMSALA